MVLSLPSWERGLKLEGCIDYLAESGRSPRGCRETVHAYICIIQK